MKRSQPATMNMHRLLLPLTACVLLCAARVCPAEDDSTARKPVAVICAANVNRVLDRLEYLLDSAGQREQFERIHGIVVNLNDLRGIDRERPVGVLVYTPHEPGGKPDVVGFVPVADMEALQVTVRISNQVSLKALEEEGRWELQGGENVLPVRVSEGYAYVAKEAELLEGTLPDVATLTQDVTTEFDVALRVLRDGISEQLMEQAVAKMRSDAAADAEQRDGESDTEHHVRMELGRIAIGALESAITDSSDVTAGLRISPEDGQGSIHVDFDANDGSGLATLLSGLAVESPNFAPAAGEQPLSLHTAWSISEDSRELLLQVLAGLRGQIGEKLKVNFTGPESKSHPVRQLLDAVDATVAEGRVEAMLRFIGEPPGGLVLIGALHIANDDDVAQALGLLIPLAGLSQDVKEVQMNAEEIEGVAFHRLRTTKLRVQDERLYGPDAALHVGVGKGALWVAVGGGQTTAALETALADSSDDHGNASSVVPLVDAEIRLSSWIGLAGTGGNRRQFVEAARLAFDDPDRDGLRIRLVPSESGLRLQAELDEGYLRLLGMALAARMKR